MKIENIYTSIGCNRTPASCDWGNNNRMIYGACNSIALMDPNFERGRSSKIVKTFVGHTKRVNCVRWIKKENRTLGEDEVLSGSDDGTCVYWRLSSDDEIVEKIVLKGHSSGITAVDGFHNNGNLTIATTSTDSTIKLWRKSTDGAIESFQSIPGKKSGFSFAVRLFSLPKTDRLVLIFSADDHSIKIYSQTEDGNFQYSNELVGHEDWVRGLDIIQNDLNELIVASGSQDTFIRLWKIRVRDDTKKIIEIGKKSEIGENLEAEEILFAVGKIMFSITLESVLQSHENWVYGVNLIQNKKSREIQLLSSSIDKTLIIWSCSESEIGIWEEKIRVGDIGGNSLGFYGGCFSPDGRSILGHGYQGSFHLWRLDDTEKMNWSPSVVVGGHFNAVNDVCWESNGQFLMSVSSDQTTRCHAPWSSVGTWHEIARPQIHGYDIQCITSISRWRFASGAEEKIIRTFQAPANFVENFTKLTGATLDTEAQGILASTQKGASVPSLGLSNRAVSNVEGESNKDDETHFTPLHLEKPPFEENLMQNTLWPEMQKLYGHGNELYAISSSPDGRFLASGCRASTAEHAQIIIWSTKTWKQTQKLSGNNLTITQLKFSPNNRFLLSVSRDRRWCLFVYDSSTDSFSSFAESPSSGVLHARIIWTCDWSHDSKVFTTGSRDGKVIAWQLNDTKVEPFAVLTLKNESMTAIAIHQRYHAGLENQYLVAVGFESGEIRLYVLANEFTQLDQIPAIFSHHLAITRLAFRPLLEGDTIQLASGGKDSLVRINQITLK